MRFFVVAAALCLALPSSWAKSKSAPPSAEEAEGGIFRVGEDVRVAAGQRRTGSIVVLGGSARIAGDVDQDVVVLGGDAEIDGTVGGDLVALGSQVRLGPSSQIKGGFVSLGAAVAKEAGSRVRGESVNLRGPGLGLLASAASGAGLLAALGLFFRLFSTIGWLLLALAAGLAAPRGLKACADSLQRRPLLSLVFGFLLYPSAAAVALALLLSLVGIPLLPPLALCVALLSAWAYLSSGQFVGGLLLPRSTASAWLPCFAGVAALQALGWIPIVGKVFCLLALLLGLGATLAAALPRSPRP